MIRSIGYDDRTQTLELEFTSKVVYQFYIVPRKLYERLMASRSKGKFFADEIRDVYPQSRD